MGLSRRRPAQAPDRRLRIGDAAIAVDRARGVRRRGQRQTAQTAGRGRDGPGTGRRLGGSGGETEPSRQGEADAGENRQRTVPSSPRRAQCARAAEELDSQLKQVVTNSTCVQ